MIIYGRGLLKCSIFCSAGVWARELEYGPPKLRAFWSSVFGRSVIRGLHIYKNMWQPYDGKTLGVERQKNMHNQHAVKLVQDMMMLEGMFPVN